MIEINGKLEDDVLLNSSQASRLLNISRETFYKLVKRGLIKKANNLTRRNIQYSKAQLMEFVHQNKPKN